jgi:hypothetical protein
MKKLLVSLFAAVMLLGCATFGSTPSVKFDGVCNTEIRRYLPQGEGTVLIANQSELDYLAIRQIEDFINESNGREGADKVEATHFAWLWDEEYNTGSAVLLFADPVATDGTGKDCKPNYGYIVELDPTMQIGDFDTIMSDFRYWIPKMALGQEGVAFYLNEWSK